MLMISPGNVRGMHENETVRAYGSHEGESVHNSYVYRIFMRAMNTGAGSFTSPANTANAQSSTSGVMIRACDELHYLLGHPAWANRAGCYGNSISSIGNQTCMAHVADD